MARISFLKVDSYTKDDQIRRIFASWSIIYLDSFFIAEIVFYYFFHNKRYALIMKKMCLSKFWANFSQTHLITLIPMS
jgi:hypothetical protein